MQKIIVPTDFSATASAALRYAHFLARATGLGLDIIHVHDGYGHTEGVNVRKGDLEAHMTAQRKIDEFVRFTLKLPADAPLSASEVIISSREVTGTPVEVIVAASREEGSRLVVMGGVGTGVVSPVTPLFGSVARSVVEQAACPVLAVPAGYDVPALHQVSIAYETVDGLRETSAGFDFLRTALMPTMRMVHVRKAGAEAEAYHLAVGGDQQPETEFLDYPAELDLLEPGATAHQLLEYTEQENIDLLILGRRQRGMFKRLFVSSAITPLLNYSAGPVLVIPISDS
ncbi:universal stress protein [Neolewinella lacunae]|uniref:Universal stress protein n=1 Tax=Neolewinella lacunae TaxID=1517758 RepID=A0A923T8B0_9BACT|nr:universal stress protein [Neolewinella lacunae]MBC6995425.1 universal stress protein [Neolewinella lacunae]MDN3633832.1 universal stress protein [Neolewinella lacunae]